MGNIIKLFILALLIVAAVTAGVVFFVPSVKKAVFAKPIPISKEQEKAKLNEEVDKEEQKIMPEKQVFELAQSLKEREKKVKEEEERLQRMALVLEKEKAEILKAKTEVESMHKDISEFIPAIDDGEKKNLKKLAKMFETLSPESANPILSRMPDQTLVIVLSFMKPRNSAKLLSGYATYNSESAKRAADLTEKLKNLVVK